MIKKSYWRGVLSQKSKDRIGKYVLIPIAKTKYILSKPLRKSIQKKYEKITSNQSNIYVRTDYPVAIKSPDHLYPFGTKQDNSQNIEFNEKFYEIAKELNYATPYRILDLGCAGGGMVQSFVKDGKLAIGLEGSDYCKKHKQFAWYFIPHNLFTCDISKPFTVYEGELPMNFDLITCWEVLEHIKEEDLPVLLKNIKSHLNGIFICSIAHESSKQNGVELHQTIRPIEWWDSMFSSYGFERREDIEKKFNNTFVRMEKFSTNRAYEIRGK